MRRWLCLWLCVGVVARAAVNPQEFINVASHHLRLREIARVVEQDRHANPTLRRVTIVAEVLEARGNVSPAGSTVVLDWTVDLAARERARVAYQETQGHVLGRQFMAEPDAPALDDKKEFWAHVAPSGGRLANVNRFAGARPSVDERTTIGPVFVPIAGQYSFTVPASAPRP